MADIAVGYDFTANEIPTKSKFEQQAQVSITGLAFGDINFQSQVGHIASSDSGVSYPAKNWLRFDVDSTLWVNFERLEARVYMGRRWGMEITRWPFGDGAPQHRREPVAWGIVDNGDTGPSNVFINNAVINDDEAMEQAETAASNSDVIGATPHRVVLMGFNFLRVDNTANARPFAVGKRDNETSDIIDAFGDPLGSQSGDTDYRYTVGRTAHDENGEAMNWVYYAGQQLFRAE